MLEFITQRVFLTKPTTLNPMSISVFFGRFSWKILNFNYVTHHYLSHTFWGISYYLPYYKNAFVLSDKYNFIKVSKWFSQKWFEQRSRYLGLKLMFENCIRYNFWKLCAIFDNFISLVNVYYKFESYKWLDGETQDEIPHERWLTSTIKGVWPVQPYTPIYLTAGLSFLQNETSAFLPRIPKEYFQRISEEIEKLLLVTEVCDN